MAKRSYKFTDKKHSRQGLAASALGLFSLVLGAVVLVMAFRQSGEAGKIVGLLGLLSMLSGVLGFILALRSFHEEDVYYLFSYIGTGVNGVLTILWMLVLTIGM